MKPLVYIASPYTFPDPVANTRDACECWHRLWASGVVTPVCPLLSMLLHFHKPLSWEEWIEYDLEVLTRCDAVLRLPGESKGADREMEEAYRLNKDMFYSERDLLKWVEYGWKGLKGDS
jgi:hypothetical protein